MHRITHNGIWLDVWPPCDPVRLMCKIYPHPMENHPARRKEWLTQNGWATAQGIRTVKQKQTQKAGGCRADSWLPALNSLVWELGGRGICKDCVCMRVHTHTEKSEKSYKDPITSVSLS